MKQTLLLAALTLAAIAVVAKAGFATDKNAPVHLSLRASEMAYTPNAIHMRAGAPVHLELHNDGKVLHDWNVVGITSAPGGHHHGKHGHQHRLEKGQLHIAVEPGKTSAVQFTPVAGEYEFYCSVPGHREAGMKGKILVH